MKKNPKSARDTNVIIQWKRIVKVRDLLMEQSNERDS